MRRPPDPVTDHAVLRYLERVYGVDVARLKVRLAKITQEGRDRQAAAITSDGVKYILSKSGRVKTVHGAHGEMSKRGLRWKARHK